MSKSMSGRQYIVKKYVLNEGLDIKRDVRETTVGVRVTGKEE